MQNLGFKIPEVLYSSDLVSSDITLVSASSTDLINYLLKTVSASDYLAAHNVQAYSSKSDYCVSQVSFQNFIPLAYSQYNKRRENKDFIPYLSILDYIASLGTNKLESYLSECNEWL